MDPNEALRELRAATLSARQQQDSDTDHESFCVVSNRTVSEMINAAEALDGWLSRGGFLPGAWDHPRGDR